MTRIVTSSGSASSSAPVRTFVRSIVVAVLFAGCHPTPPAAGPAGTTGAQLAQSEAIRIAAEAAVSSGYVLAEYEEPRVEYEHPRWTVLYEGRVATPGNHFLVWVDDETGEPQVMAGE